MARKHLGYVFVVSVLLATTSAVPAPAPRSHAATAAPAAPSAKMEMEAGDGRGIVRRLLVEKPGAPTDKPISVACTPAGLRVRHPAEPKERMVDKNGRVVLNPYAFELARLKRKLEGVGTIDLVGEGPYATAWDSNTGKTTKWDLSTGREVPRAALPLVGKERAVGVKVFSANHRAEVQAILSPDKPNGSGAYVVVDNATGKTRRVDSKGFAFWISDDARVTAHFAGGETVFHGPDGKKIPLPPGVPKQLENFSLDATGTVISAVFQGRWTRLRYPTMRLLSSVKLEGKADCKFYTVIADIPVLMCQNYETSLRDKKTTWTFFGADGQKLFEKNPESGIACPSAQGTLWVGPSLRPLNRIAYEEIDPRALLRSGLGIDEKPRPLGDIARDFVSADSGAHVRALFELQSRPDGAKGAVQAIQTAPYQSGLTDAIRAFLQNDLEAGLDADDQPKREASQAKVQGILASLPPEVVAAKVTPILTELAKKSSSAEVRQRVKRLLAVAKGRVSPEVAGERSRQAGLSKD